MDCQTPEGRKDILHKINDYRDKLARGKIPGWPKAANMRQLSWDHDNEHVAFRWAQQCIPGVDKCRSTFEFVYVGQNYCGAREESKFPSPDICFEKWTKEKNNVEDVLPLVKKYDRGSWSYFTQLIWADTYKLGCSKMNTTMKVGDTTMKTIFMHCNFAPGGNYIEDPMYEIGEPCSKCLQGTKCRKNSTYPNLCALPTDALTPTTIIGIPDKVSIQSSCKTSIAILITTNIIYHRGAI